MRSIFKVKKDINRTARFAYLQPKIGNRVTHRRLSRRIRSNSPATAQTTDSYPVQYISLKTTNAERNYPSYDLEVLAVIKALYKFRVYLQCIPFKIVTDCSAFEKTMKKRDMIPRVARWGMFLADFDYTIG